MAKNVEIDTHVQSNSAYKSMISKLEGDIRNENALIDEKYADYIVKINVLNNENNKLREELYKRCADAETQVEEETLIVDAKEDEIPVDVKEEEAPIVEEEASIVEEEAPVDAKEDEIPVDAKEDEIPVDAKEDEIPIDAKE
tara:strand:- start:1659 stop:2084 length:426 start_codon:yes stop_codon:yes gene_type:complete